MSLHRLTPAAKDDLIGIVRYLHAQSPQGARIVKRDLLDAARHLGQNPEIGFYRADLASEPVRFWRVHSYFLIYRPEPRPIEIVRVIHAARDIGALLAGKP